MQPAVAGHAPEFVQNVLGQMIARKGDLLPVSALPIDGTYPSGTTQWEKRNLAEEIPVWDPNICIQCGKCAMVCPHAVIRIKAYDPAVLADAPATFKAVDARDTEWSGLKYTIQVAPEDCTGCSLCVDVCPAKNKSAVAFKAINMRPQPPIREQERENWEFFTQIPELDRRFIKTRIGGSSRLAAFVSSKFSNPCLSSRAHAPVVAKHPTSSSLPSSLAITQS